MRCHACGAERDSTPGEAPGFREECDGCGADLHVCRNCAHHDPAAYNGCRESSAERVSDAERANRCEYFRALSDVAPGSAAGAGESERAAALGALDKLFRKD